MFDFKNKPRKIDLEEKSESSKVEFNKTGSGFINISPINYIYAFKDKMPKKSLIPIQLLTFMDRDNKIYLTLDELSEKLNYPKTGLSVLFKEYREQDYLIKIRNGLYMVNPLVFYKGSKYERDKLIAEYTKHRK